MHECNLASLEVFASKDLVENGRSGRPNRFIACTALHVQFLKWNNFVETKNIVDPYEYRKKRALMSEKEKESYDLQKVILLETIGNARLDESYDYIISHINSTNSQWIKRAGCHALRKYDHQHVIIFHLICFWYLNQLHFTISWTKTCMYCLF